MYLDEFLRKFPFTVISPSAMRWLKSQRDCFMRASKFGLCVQGDVTQCVIGVGSHIDAAVLFRRLRVVAEMRLGSG